MTKRRLRFVVIRDKIIYNKQVSKKERNKIVESEKSKDIFYSIYGIFAAVCRAALRVCSIPGQ